MPNQEPFIVVRGRTDAKPPCSFVYKRNTWKDANGKLQAKHTLTCVPPSD